MHFSYPHLLIKAPYSRLTTPSRTNNCFLLNNPLTFQIPISNSPYDGELSLPYDISVSLRNLISMQAAPIIYAIRHGEKPADGANNLSSQGLARAQRLRQFFGKKSGFNIGYIVVEHPKKGLSTILVFPFLLFFCGIHLLPSLALAFVFQNFRGSSEANESI
jgi:hypothetical protein